MIVAQARLPVFYRDYAVADTVNGRFDLIVLHLALVLDRLTVGRRAAKPRAGLFDLFCRDMDDNLREMGISDLKVPKEMRRMGEAFYGRSRPISTRMAAQEPDAGSGADRGADPQYLWRCAVGVGRGAPACGLYA